MTDITTQSLIESLFTPILAGGTIFVYDVFYEKKNYSQSSYDGALMLGSLFITKWIDSMLDKQIISVYGNENLKSITNYISQPAINALIYNYAYNMLFRTKYNIGFNSRSMGYTSMILGGSVGLVNKFGEPYLLTLLTGIQSFNIL
jgi:hypothetical protein